MEFSQTSWIFFGIEMDFLAILYKTKAVTIDQIETKTI